MIAQSMTCPRCGGDVEYETERDGAAWVLFTPLVWDEGLRDFRTPEHEDFTHGITNCLCVWRADELERLHDAATERALDWVQEP